MKNLSKSPFFDKRLIPLVQRLLFGQKVSVISGAETAIVNRKDEIVLLNSTYNGQLIKLLLDIQNYAPVEDVLFFLLEAQKRDKSEDAKEALEAVIVEKMIVDRAALKEILKKGETMPMVWAVSLYGEDEEGRHTEPVEEKSSIDINRLRSFK